MSESDQDAKVNEYTKKFGIKQVCLLHYPCVWECDLLKNSKLIINGIEKEIADLMEMLKHDCNYCKVGTNPKLPPCKDCNDHNKWVFDDRKMKRAKIKIIKMDIKSSEYDKCPICGDKSETSCKCIMADSECKNGHHWHYCHIHKCKVSGEGDHKKDAFKQCVCEDGE